MSVPPRIVFSTLAFPDATLAAAAALGRRWGFSGSPKSRSPSIWTCSPRG